MKMSSFIKGDITLTKAQNKQREVLMYLVFGGLTTLVSMVTFFLLDLAFANASDLIINTIAWVVAVMFAFLTNRAWVFCSKGPFFREMVAFFSARIVSLILFELLLFAFLLFILENGFNISPKSIFVTYAGLDFKWNFIVKIINSVFVIVSNYFFSKWFIFTKKDSVTETLSPDSDSDDNTGVEDV